MLPGGPTPHQRYLVSTFFYRPTVKPCGLDRETLSADNADGSVSRPPPAIFGQLLPHDNTAIGP